MMPEKKNLGASVTARLLNRAKQTGDDYQTLLASYCFERLLYRLGASELRDRFVLKGAMLLRLWADQPYRATQDLDLLRRGDGSQDAIRSDIRAIISTPVAPDGVEIDGAHVRVETIRAEDEFAGTRVTLAARCGTARLPLRIDVGLGDAVWPTPQSCTYPVLLDFSAPNVLAYPREAVVAEKLHAMVVFGDRNSRIKDFFDLHYLATHFEFDRATLAEAVRRTFQRRRTPIPGDAPIGLTSAYWENPSRPVQVLAFARRAKLAMPKEFASEFVRVLAAFLFPLLDDLRDETNRNGTWKPGGPWR
jgi:nucleotidyltransferase AbiEii toxin of type IV toxin-antitoxin system